MAFKPAYEICGITPVPDVSQFIHAITLQEYGLGSPPVYDDAGPVMSWNDFQSAMAAVVPVRGIDVIRGGQGTTQLFLTITMWWSPGILPNMRVVSDNGSKYVIQSIENILERNIVLVLNCLGLGPND